MKESLIVHELKLAEQSFSSAASLAEASNYIKFPENVAGLRMLDIGGGASTATIELRKRGTQAFAIDYLYGNLPRLKRSANEMLNKSIQQPSREDLEREIKKKSRSSTPKTTRC